MAATLMRSLHPSKVNDPISGYSRDRLPSGHMIVDHYPEGTPCSDH